MAQLFHGDIAKRLDRFSCSGSARSGGSEHSASAAVAAFHLATGAEGMLPAADR
jgi:hypothetical protein